LLSPLADFIFIFITPFSAFHFRPFFTLMPPLISRHLRLLRCHAFRFRH
jgi:hypothetical protein